MTKYIVVTGGVLSGLGKGVAAASIGWLLSPRYKIVPIKCDGYLNVDPGTMNPVEHGEVYVLDDGGEVDMDFGHYERFLNVDCKKGWNLTMGKVFDRVRKSERRGDYLGQTVQMVPHVTDTILQWWKKIARDEQADVILLEIGGTVGDMENELFLEAVRRLKRDVGPKNVLLTHLTYVPVVYGTGEQKSKPTQHSVALLRERGLIPDMIIGRCSRQLTDTVKRKIAVSSGLEIAQIITGIDARNVFEIPLLFKGEGLDKVISEGLDLNIRSEFSKYRNFIKNMNEPAEKAKIAICGKYTELDDSYASVISAIKIAAAQNGFGVDIDLIETTDIEKNKISVKDVLKGYDGVVVPGGWGSRGIEGKIEVIKYCREKDIPYLGLCLGLQLAVIEFARNICGIKDANSTEVDSGTKDPVVFILPEKKKLKNMGGTLRLGAYPAQLKHGSLVRRLYGKKVISERHRHRYEVNPEYHEVLQQNGMVLSGMSPKRDLVEFVEIPNHKFFIATQAHPEFKNPAPLFLGFTDACMKRRDS